MVKDKKFIIGDFSDIDLNFYNWYVKQDKDILTIKEINEVKGVVVPKEFECEIPFENILVESNKHTNLNIGTFSNGKVTYYKSK